MSDPVPWPKVKRSLVAILRGIKPSEAEAIVDVLIDVGFELIEIPLNSPDPFVSIERLCKRFGKDSHIGGPFVEGALCTGEVLAHDRAKKIIVYKQRPKKGFRKKQGHRQGYTRVMIDKITAVSRAKLGARLGRLSDQDMLRINRALVVFLGLG